MQMRESRLLIVAVALGMLAVVPLACGGKDDNNNNNNGGDTDTDPNSLTSICTDIKDKLDSCSSQLSCESELDTTNFVATCVQTNEFTADVRDQTVAASCAVIDEDLCEGGNGPSPCPSGFSCGGLTNENVGGACVNSNNDPDPAGTACVNTGDCQLDELCLSTIAGDAMRCTKGCCIDNICGPVTSDGANACVIGASSGSYSTRFDAKTCANGNDCDPDYACLGGSNAQTKDGTCVWICSVASAGTSYERIKRLIK